MPSPLVRASYAAIAVLLLLPGLARAEQPSPAPPAASVTVDERGFVVTSPDQLFQLRLGAILQFDGRAFFGDDSPPLTDTFLIRSARPIVDASFNDFIDFRFMSDFGEGRISILDVYADLRLRPWLKLQLGKFKPPVGLERLQAEQNILFIERAFPTGLVPSRDVGVQLHGDVAEGALTYALGLFNGAPDGAVGDTDVNEGKDVEARILVHPFRLAAVGALKNVGIGLAATYGLQTGTPEEPNLPSFKSPAQQTFFTYASGAVPSGERYRLAPQLYAYIGPFGLLSEYVVSSQSVTRDTSTAQLANQAWQVAASFVVTGEDASFDGVVPAHPVRFAKGYLGALEVAARYQELRVDPDTFPNFADPTKSARQARAFDVGLNWYLTRNGRASLNFNHTDYAGGGATGARQPENALVGRFQLAF